MGPSDRSPSAAPDDGPSPGLSVGWLVVTRDGVVRHANEVALRMLGVAGRHPPDGGWPLADLDVRSLEELVGKVAGHDGSRSTILSVGAAPGSRHRVCAEASLLDGRGSEVVVTLRTETGASGPEVPPDMFYRAFLDSRDAIEVTDRDGILVDVNPAFERIYGYSRAECIGKRPNIVRSRKTPDATYRQMWTQLHDPAAGHWSGEMVNRDRFGHEHTVLLTIDAFRNRDGAITHFIGVATDVSEQRSLQLQAIRQERLASLGQLAAGVAHEVNTPLANILLVSESLQRRSTDLWVRQRAETIAHQVESAAKIVRGLLEFARSHPPALGRADLVGISHEAVEFLRGKQSADITVRERHAAPVLPVLANRIQVLQVLVNLVNNAVDAMDDRGELSIDSRTVDGWAEVSVTDHGTGISPTVLPHLFEPFFTTKPPGKGTGLGLSICHGIVQAHGGSITVRTEQGHGSTFTVRLPLAPPEADRPGDPAVPGGRGGRNPP